MKNKAVAKNASQDSAKLAIMLSLGLVAGLVFYLLAA